MSNITAAEVNKLRKATGAGMMDCKKALVEANGNFESAIENLRKKGQKVAAKRADRESSEGAVIAMVNDQMNKGVVISLNCETDFVAKNEDFINFVKELSEINLLNNSDVEKIKKVKMKNTDTVENNLVSIIAKIGEKITIGRAKTISNENSLNFSYLHSVVKDNLSKLAVVVSLNTKEKNEKINIFGKQLAMHIAASSPIALESKDIPQSIIEKEQELVTEELKNSGKPDEIVKKISLGKINKFKEDNSLLSQPWVMEPKKKVKDILKELNISDLKINDFFRLKIGE